MKALSNAPFSSKRRDRDGVSHIEEVRSLQQRFADRPRASSDPCQDPTSMHFAHRNVTTSNFKLLSCSLRTTTAVESCRNGPETATSYREDVRSSSSARRVRKCSTVGPLKPRQHACFFAAANAHSRPQSCTLSRLARQNVSA